jgi:hypothetical protein
VWAARVFPNYPRRISSTVQTRVGRWAGRGEQAGVSGNSIEGRLPGSLLPSGSMGPLRLRARGTGPGPTPPMPAPRSPSPLGTRGPERAWQTCCTLHWLIFSAVAQGQREGSALMSGKAVPVPGRATGGTVAGHPYRKHTAVPRPHMDLQRGSGDERPGQLPRDSETLTPSSLSKGAWGRCSQAWVLLAPRMDRWAHRRPGGRVPLQSPHLCLEAEAPSGFQGRKGNRGRGSAEHGERCVHTRKGACFFWPQPTLTHTRIPSPGQHWQVPDPGQVMTG